MRPSRYVDNDSGYVTRIENRAEPGSVRSINGHCLGNGNRAEAAWIEDIDFTAFGSLRNRARKCFAGGRAATGISVVTDARDPSARCLSIGRGDARDKERRDSYEDEVCFCFHVGFLGLLVLSVAMLAAWKTAGQ